MTESLERRLEAWERAELISADQAARIARYEQDDDDSAPDRRSGAAEAVGYVGTALAFGALALLLDDLWQQIVPTGRVAMASTATVLLAVAGWTLRNNPAEPMRRLTSVLFAAVVAGVAWVVFLLTDEVWDLADVDVAAWVAATAFATALLVHRMRHRALGQLVLLAAAVAVVAAALARPAIAPAAVWTGLSYWGLGGVWLLLGLGEWLPPRRVAVTSGGVLTLLALQFAGFDTSRMAVLILAVTTGVALIALAVAIRQTPLMLVGAVGIFVLIPQLAFELFGDAVGAPATLLISGVLLVVGAVVLGRVRRDVGRVEEEADDVLDHGFDRGPDHRPARS